MTSLQWELVQERQSAPLPSRIERVLGGVLFLIVGELINSSRQQVGKAIRDKDDALIRSLARSQIEAGADAIDLSAGESVREEKENLLWLIEVVESELGPDVRLAIDTSDPDIMKAGLAACSGRPTANSISNEAGKQDLIEVTARAEAGVIGLSMGEYGMPKSAQDRVSESEALLQKCLKAGLDRDQLYVDVICMSVASSQDQGKAVLQAVQRVKTEVGVKTLAAVSNVSFGLPNRRLLNRTYLSMLLEVGLDGAILDATDEGIRDTMTASCALRGEDKYCLGHIKHHRRRRRT